MPYKDPVKRREYLRKWRKANAEKWKAYQKKWWEESDYRRIYKERHPEKVKQYQKDYRQRCRSEWATIIKERFGEIKCKECGYAKSFSALTFHHTTDDKCHNIASLIRIKPTPDRIEELSKCEILCANCHSERTFEMHEEFQRLLKGDVT